MTTIIIIIAVAALVGLGSKIFLKDSSKGGLSDQGGMAPGPGESSSSAKKEKATGSPVEKALKISPGMDTSGANLFRPPPDHTLFTGQKEALIKIAAHATTRPILIGVSGFSGVGKTSFIIPLMKKFAPQFSGTCLLIDMQGDHPDPCGGYHAADHFKIPPYPAPAR